MQYTVGQQFLFRRYYAHAPEEVVTVAGLRKNGCAKLSNGWVVDPDGHAEGTGRVPGGYLCQLSLAKDQHGVKPADALAEAMFWLEAGFLTINGAGPVAPKFREAHAVTALELVQQARQALLGEPVSPLSEEAQQMRSEVQTVLAINRAKNGN